MDCVCTHCLLFAEQAQGRGGTEASALKAEVWKHLALSLSSVCCEERVREHCLLCAVQVKGCGGAGKSVSNCAVEALCPRLELLTVWTGAESLSAVLCREEAVFEQGERQMERLLTLQELAEDEVSDAA